MNKLKEETLMKKNTISHLTTKVYLTISSSVMLLATSSGIVLAKTDSTSVTGPLDRLTNMIYDIVAGIGVIALIFGILQLALAFKSHDPQQKTAAAIGIVGGIILIAIRGIVALILGK